MREEVHAPHIQAKRGQVGSYVFLRNDPDGALKIAERFDSAEEVRSRKETFGSQYRIWTGKVAGVTVSACSTGIGSPAAAIAVEELTRIGADTFIRVGLCGSLIPDLECGDLAISTAAVRLDGTTKHYVQAEYPAIASCDVTLALIEAAGKLGKNCRAGYTASTDSFYVGQGRPGANGYLPPSSEQLIEQLQRQRVITMEMEASTIFTLAGLYGLRSGCVLSVCANRVKDEFEVKDEDGLCKVAVEAVRILSKWDADLRKTGRSHWSPRLSYG